MAVGHVVGLQTREAARGVQQRFNSLQQFSQQMDVPRAHIAIMVLPASPATGGGICLSDYHTTRVIIHLTKCRSRPSQGFPGSPRDHQMKHTL